MRTDNKNNLTQQQQIHTYLKIITKMCLCIAKWIRPSNLMSEANNLSTLLALITNVYIISTRLSQRTTYNVELKEVNIALLCSCPSQYPLLLDFSISSLTTKVPELPSWVYCKWGTHGLSSITMNNKTYSKITQSVQNSQWNSKSNDFWYVKIDNDWKKEKDKCNSEASHFKILTLEFWFLLFMWQKKLQRLISTTNNE